MKQMLAGLEYYGKQIFPYFQIDESNIEVCKQLIMYFNSDPKFEECGNNFSLLKGLLIRGPVGSGKTALMKAIDSLIANTGNKNSFVIVPTRTIERDFIDSGNEIINYYGKNSRSVNSTRVYCFDDLGLESAEAKFYGNHVKVMAEILLDRYDLGLLTHATTNLAITAGDNSLITIYGDRVVSRMHEMFNDIKLFGEDRRKKRI